MLILGYRIHDSLNARSSKPGTLHGTSWTVPNKHAAYSAPWMGKHLAIADDQHVDHVAGEDYLHSFAGERFQGDIEQAAVRILNDYRSGLLGRICLELPGQLSG